MPLQFNMKLNIKLIFVLSSLLITSLISIGKGEIDDTQKATTLLNEGRILYNKGDFKEAVDKLEDSLMFFKRIDNKRGIGAASAILGASYSRLGKYSKSLECCAEALEIFKLFGFKEGEKQVLIEVKKVFNSYISQDHSYPEMLEFYGHYLNLFRNKINKQDEGKILANIGTVYMQSGNCLEAINYYAQAREIFKNIGDRDLELGILTQLADTFSGIFDYRNALYCYETALKISKEIHKQNDQEGYLVLNMGVMLKNLGNWMEALKYIQRACEIFKATDCKSGEGMAILNIGTVYSDCLTDIQEAFKYAEHALKIHRSIGKKYEEALNLHFMGGLYMRNGDYQKALNYFEDALGIFRDKGAKKNEGETLEQMGLLYNKQGDNQKALEYFEAALKIYETNKIIFDQVFTNNIVETLIAQKDYRKIIEFCAKMGPYGDLKLADLYNRTNEYSKAINCYEKLLEREYLLPDFYIYTYLGMAEAQERSGRLRDASISYLKAIKQNEKVRSYFELEETKVGFLSRRVEFYQKFTSVLARLHLQGERLEDIELLEYGNNCGNVAFHFVEHARTRSLLEILAGKRDTGKVYKLPDELFQKEQNLIRQISKMKLQIGSVVVTKDIQLVEKEAERLSDMEAELEEFIRTVRKEHPQYAALKYPQPIRLEDVPLAPNEILLEYQITEKATYLFVVGYGKLDKNSPQNSQKKLELLKLVEIPISREELKRKVKDFRRPFEDTRHINEFDPLKAKELYELLLAEGVKRLPPETHLIIVPDDILNLLPFETLVVSTEKIKKVESKREVGVAGCTGIVYAGDVWRMSYYQSATVLGLNRQTGKESREWESPLFALGDPVFDKEDGRYAEFIRGKKKEVTLASVADEALIRVRSLAKERGYTFSRLEETRDEVVQISEILKEKKQPYIRLDMDASEAGVKGTNLTGCRYVHFATHGILGNEIPYILEPALVLNLVNNADEDGYLTMSEIMGLDMEADMVTLSACKTGLGEDVGGEGVVGLTRAFMYAGSPSVLVSLWSVANESTTDFMVSVYSYLKEGKDKAEAVRLAKMDLRKRKYKVYIGRGMEVAEKGAAKAEKTVVIDASHPYFWAPFILVGEYK